MTDGLKDKHREAVLKVLTAHPDVEKVVLFGSRATGTFTPESDVDLCLFGDTLTSKDLARLSARIEELSVPQRVDLLLYDRITEKGLLQHIQKKGSVWLEGHEKKIRSSKETGNTSEAFPVEQLIQDGVLTINDGYRAKNTELSDFGIPFARAGNIDGGFHFETADRVPPKTLARVGIKRSQPGDVVFTSKGTVGRFAFVREATPEFVYSPQLCFWRSNNSSRILPRWLYYWMNSEEFFLQYKSVAGQTDMADYVSLRDQRRMRITLPPLPTQKTIAHILGTLDDKIELNRKMNRTLEAMAAAIFKSWFVDFDPVHAKAEGRDPGLPPHIVDLFPNSFQDSELGEIPEGWTVKPLDEIADYLNGLACQKHPATEGQKSLPVIKIRELRQGTSNNTDRASVDVPPKYIVEDGDILFSWSGSLLVAIWCGGRGVLNQHLFKVTSPTYPKWYFYQATKHHLEEFQRIASDKATTMGHIKRHHLADAKMAIPDEKLMEKSTEVMGPMLAQQISALKQVRMLAMTRDTLLPELLSGEIKLGARHG